MKKDIRSILVKLNVIQSCLEVEEFVPDYVGSNLSYINRIRILIHLLFCIHCRLYIESYRLSIRLVKEFFANPDYGLPSEMPEHFTSHILDNIDK